MSIKRKNITTGLLVLIAVFWPFAYVYGDLFPLPEGPALSLDEIADLLNNFANFMIYSSGFVMVIFLIWAGITYMRAGGNDKIITEAKARLKQGVIGALIILGVGVILNTGEAIVTRDFFGGSSDGGGNPPPPPAGFRELCGRSSNPPGAECTPAASLTCVNVSGTRYCKKKNDQTCTADVDCASNKCEPEPAGSTTKVCKP